MYTGYACRYVGEQIPLGRTRRELKGNIKKDIHEEECGTDWNDLD